MNNSTCCQENFFIEESEFFSKKSVKIPDYIIRAESLNHVERFLENFSYPFQDTSLKDKSGCYFFFDDYRLNGDIVDFASLYVGKSIQFNKRLNRHWSSYNNDLSAYIESAIFGDPDFEIDLGSIREHHLGKLIPSGQIQIALWLENNPKERMFMEHELIYKLRPMFNKA